MLARHLNALLATLLIAFPAGASEPAIAQALDACGCRLSACMADSAALAGCDASCNQRCCPHLFVDPPYCWYVQADAFVLSRTSGRNRPLIVASDTAATVLATSDLDVGFQLGPRILVGRHIDPDHGWELSYFGLHEWSASAVADDANNLDIAGSLVGVAEDYSGADRVAIGYASRLHNAEANMLDHRDSWSALVGLRYIHLNEEVILTATDRDSGTSDYTAQSQNDLFGLQLGFRRAALRDCWGWDLTAKAGVYASVMQQQQLLLDNGNTFMLRNGSARAGSAAFLGDIDLVGFYQLSDVWSLRGGYCVMYVAGVALATDQLDFNNLATSGQRVSRGDLFLHGASLGLEARW